MRPESGYFDPHVHTDCSHEGINYSPEEAVCHAKSLGLDGLAITDHYTIEGARNALIEAEKQGLVVIPGIEFVAFSVTNQLPYPVHFPHILGLGLDPEIVEDDWKRLIAKSPDRIIDQIHLWGGIAIAAHPQSRPGYSAFSYRELTKQMAGPYPFDATEGFTSWGLDQELVFLASRLGLPLIGSSDAHKKEHIGGAGILVSKLGSWPEAVNQIKEGRFSCFRPEFSKNPRESKSLSLLRQIASFK